MHCLDVAVRFQDVLLEHTHFSIKLQVYNYVYTAGALVQALLENVFTLSALSTEYPEHSHLLPEAKELMIRQEPRAMRECLSVCLCRSWYNMPSTARKLLSFSELTKEHSKISPRAWASLEKRFKLIVVRVNEGMACFQEWTVPNKSMSAITSFSLSREKVSLCLGGWGAVGGEPHKTKMVQSKLKSFSYSHRTEEQWNIFLHISLQIIQLRVISECWIYTQSAFTPLLPVMKEA